MSESPATIPLRLVAIAEAIAANLGDQRELRALLAPLCAGRIQTFGSDTDLLPGAVPFVCVDQEGRAGTHIARGPVSIHLRTRMNAQISHIPFLVADLREQDPGPWFDLYLLRELEALRLVRVRIEQGMSFPVPLHGFEAPADVAQKHRLAAALLEQAVGSQFTRFLQDLRRAGPHERLKASMLLAGDFCGEITSAWKGTDQFSQAYVAAALFHEVAS